VKITVYAHPNSKVERIEKTDRFEYAAYFNVAPEGGKANRKVCEMLAKYFDVPKSSVQIRAGEHSKAKIVEILANPRI
jgi:uncharacterized protein YggU (UPF0235/DUF167 family)